MNRDELRLFLFFLAIEFLLVISSTSVNLKPRSVTIR